MKNFDNLDNYSLLANRFHEKFSSLRKKVHRVLDNDPSSMLDDAYEVYVNSILVDCRAIFIENKRYKKNCTIQNYYRATNNPEFATSIDELFDRKILNDISLKKVIKSWVDKNIVHFDFISNEEEDVYLKGISAAIDRATINNIFIDIMLIAKAYENYRKNLREHAYAVIETMTSGRDS